jgi:hypothetical protein
MRALLATASVIALGVAACGSSKTAPPPEDGGGLDHPPGATADATADVSADVGDVPAGDALSPPDTIGQAYTCFPPPDPTVADGGVAAQPVTCVVGQSYCLATRPRGSAGSFAQCADVPAACASSPTCACIAPGPSVSCSCADQGGLVVVTCDRV